MVDIIFRSPGHMIFCLTDHGLWETRDNGQTFTELPIRRIDGAKSVSAGSLREHTIVVGLGSWGPKGLAVSHDGGKRFTLFPDLRNRFRFIAFHPSIAGLVFAGPYKSTDFGRNWRRLSETIRAISTKGDKLYALRSGNPKQTALLVSRDSGASFSAELELDVPKRAINQMVTATSDTIFLATTRGVYVIKDQRVALRDYRHGLAKDAFGTMYTESVACDPKNPHIVFAGRRALGFGNGNGVFVSLDHGRQWQEANFNLSPGITVFAIKIDPFDSSVYIGTSFGTFRMKHRPERFICV